MRKTINPKLQGSINRIREFIKMDGGDIEIVRYDEKKNILFIKLKGKCGHCPIAQVTVKQGIQKELRKDFPNIIVEKV